MDISFLVWNMCLKGEDFMKKRKENQGIGGGIFCMEVS